MTEGNKDNPVGRLAPSPTGALHLGNVRSFLLAWLSIRSRGGVLLCRVEDLDGPRIKEGAAEQALDELSWLGLEWDAEPVLQSARRDRYEMALDHLKTRDYVYPCVCTRSEIERAQSAPQEIDDHGTRYPGTCRERFRDATEAQRMTGRDPAWRFCVPDAQVVGFEDGLHGRVEIDVSADCGDFVVAKKDGQLAYQLAVVVDDSDFGITEVLKGDDLLSSTPRQLLLYEALGVAAPSFVHVPLVIGADGRRLAKRHGDTRVAHYRRRGIEPEEILGFVAYSAGLFDRPTARSAVEILDVYESDRISRDPYVLDRDPWRD